MGTTIRELVKNSVEGISENSSLEDKAKAEELLIKVLEENMLPKDAMGLDDAFLEKMYGDAYVFFQAGKYEKAMGMYRILMLLNPLDARHPRALASCYHRLKNYFAAIMYYGLASSLDPSDPLPYYHASDCLIHQGNEGMALVLLKTMVEKMGNDPKYVVLKERVEQSVKALEDEIKGV